MSIYCRYCREPLDMQWKMETYPGVTICRECFIKDDPDKCACQMRTRKLDEDQYDWLKDCMCMHHWMQTDHYRAKSDRCILCDAPNHECECGVIPKGDNNE
jgi:hypothetical protein